MYIFNFLHEKKIFLPLLRVFSFAAGVGLKAASSLIKSEKFCPPLAVPVDTGFEAI